MLADEKLMHIFDDVEIDDEESSFSNLMMLFSKLMYNLVFLTNLSTKREGIKKFNFNKCTL